MKNFIFGLTFLISVNLNISFAQFVKWEENFDSTGIINKGWKIVNNDSGAFYSEFYKPFQFLNSEPQSSHAGNYFLKLSFENVNADNLIDDWIITPKLLNIQQGDSIFFWCGAIDGLYKDSLRIWISTTDNELINFRLVDYFKVQGPAGSWYKKGYDLSAYTGQNIFFAVNYYIKNGGALGIAGDVVWIDHFVLTGKESPGIEVTSYELSQNFPNPFNPVTVITFTVPNSSNVIIKIYDTSGRELTTLINGFYTKGKYNINFNASNFASGVYFYEMSAVNSLPNAGQVFSDTKKMELIK